MKLLIVLLAVLVGIWLWKRGRRLSRQQEPSSSRARSRPRQAQIMMSCPVCGVHIPLSDAVQGQRNSYCSVAHRREAEGS